MNPAINIFANILYSLSQRDIDTVIIDGKVLVRGGKLLTIDVKEVVKEAMKSLCRNLEDDLKKNKRWDELWRVRQGKLGKSSMNY
jgi:hypothetical protein